VLRVEQVHAAQEIHSVVRITTNLYQPAVLFRKNKMDSIIYFGFLIAILVICYVLSK
jgi:uncharacterized MnhB-related membrane protein